MVPLWPWSTCEARVDPESARSRQEVKAAAIETMNRVGIPDAANRYDLHPHQFSGGLRQRLVISFRTRCWQAENRCAEVCPNLGTVGRTAACHIPLG